MKRSILLLISHTCNLSCKYCYERFKDARKMTVAEIKKILEKEFKDNPSEITNIDLLGGEPLTNFEVIPEICNWVWGRMPKMQFFIRTNGTLLSQEMKEWFAKHKTLVGLGISIDGNPKVNQFNRGVQDVDLDYFHSNWPDVPAKITIFPESVNELTASIQYLHNYGFNITGGLAQGVLWDSERCNELSLQMEQLVDFYSANSALVPPEPLFSLKFHQAYNEFDESKAEIPCWSRNIVNTYDCDNEMLPCHMFSKLIQGQQGRLSIVEDYKTIHKEIVDATCAVCPVRWTCVNCMALNYCYHKDFGNNISREFCCDAHKITAYWSAVLLVKKAEKGLLDLANETNRDGVSKAIRYIKEYDSLG